MAPPGWHAVTESVQKRGIAVAISSLLRLVVVVLILIALALTSGLAWGTFGQDDQRLGSVDSINAPNWLNSTDEE